MGIKCFMVGLFITTIMFCSCEHEDEYEKKTDTFSISLSKGNSYFNYYFKATIDQNGLLQVTETNSLINVNRTSEYRLVDADIKLIKEKLDVLSALDISDAYGFENENAPTDLLATKLTYKTTIKSDSTSIYFPSENELPSDLDSLLHAVELVILDYDTFINI